MCARREKSPKSPEEDSGRDDSRAAERLARLEELLCRLDSRSREHQRQAAAFLHDTPLQLLSSAAMRLTLARERDSPDECAEELERAEHLLRDGVKEVRRVTHELRQRAGAWDDDLIQALRALCERAEDLLGLEMQLEIESERRPADNELTQPLTEALRLVLLELSLQGAAGVLLRYADGADGELVVSVSAPELECNDPTALRARIERTRSLLATFDVSSCNVGPSVRFVVPEPLVGRELLFRRAPARSRSE